jgi:hypothetical protein
VTEWYEIAMEIDPEDIPARDIEIIGGQVADTIQALSFCTDIGASPVDVIGGSLLAAYALGLRHSLQDNDDLPAGLDELLEGWQE